MFNVLSIRPSKDLRTNYAQISIQNPVAITVNGKEDTVILCHDDYMQQQRYISELEARLALYAHLAQASEDIIHGRVQNTDDALDDILEELDDLEL